MTGYGEDKDTLNVEFGHLFEMGRLDEAIAETVGVSSSDTATYTSADAPGSAPLPPNFPQSTPARYIPL